MTSNFVYPLVTVRQLTSDDKICYVFELENILLVTGYV